MVIVDIYIYFFPQDLVNSYFAEFTIDDRRCESVTCGNKVRLHTVTVQGVPYPETLILLLKRSVVRKKDFVWFIKTR